MKKSPITMALDYISNVLQGCCILIMAFLIVAVSIQVFARYVLRNPTSWSESMAQIAFIWLTVFGCTVVTRDRSALNVDLLQAHVDGRLYWGLLLICDVISTIVCAFWLYSSVLQISNTWSIYEGGLNIRRGVIYCGIAFSFGMMVVFQIVNALSSLINLIKNEPGPIRGQEEE